MCSAHHKIFAFTYTFDIMQFDNMLQTFFNASFRGSRHYQPELSNLPAIGFKVVEIRSKVWNMFKLIITTPASCQLISLQCFYCKLYTHFTTCLVFVLLILNNQLFLGSCFLFARRYKDKQPCEILPKSSCSADSKKAV